MACRCGGGDRCGRGRVTGQLAGAARWAGELAAAGRALGVGADGAPVVQLAVMMAAATATSGAARFMQSLSAAPPPSGREDRPAWLSRVLRARLSMSARRAELERLMTIDNLT